MLKGSKKKLVKFQNTIIRMPTDYDTHPNHHPVGTPPAAYMSFTITLTFPLTLPEPRKFEFDDNYKNMISMTLDQYESEVLPRDARRAAAAEDAAASSLMIAEAMGDDLLPDPDTGGDDNRSKEKVLLDEDDLM